MNSSFDTGAFKFEELPREEQELLVVDSALNKVEIEYWATGNNTWNYTCAPCWNNNTRYRRKPAPPEVSEVAKNIRRNLSHMHCLLRPGDERDSQLIDIINHVDAMAQQLNDFKKDGK